MAAEDISRTAFYPSKRYRGVRMQQGRVLSDDDWNSQDDIAADDIRSTRLHVIGPAGSPDDGFRMTPVVPAPGEIDFELAAGTYYVSGHRVTLHAPIRYAAQPDWLDQPASERSRPTAPRTDFAYLEVWEQPVTAVEDDELLEKALGGPDTTTRRRLMARVRLLRGIDAADCDEAWDLLAAELAGRGTLAETGELIPDLSLQVAYLEDGVAGDLCSPSVTAGYLGAENQAIRVQLMDGRLVWGLDAAAVPYRATIDAAGSVVTLLSQPKDAVHWPLAGQTIEILRPAAALDNGEVLAALRGHVTTVAVSYDPTTAQLTLSDPHPDGAELAALDHVYVRMWRRGTDLSSPATTPVTPGTPVTLGNLGITVTVTGDDLQADAFWVIAVRPETPDQVVPWQLESGRAPEGVRCFYAPLGMLRWTPGSGDSIDVEIEDCRPPFAPLTAQRGCCRYTVGDGHTSRGQFSSIQAAIDALPASGGVICLLPGTWEENVVIRNRRDITIHGCRERSRVRALDPQRATFSILGSEGIRLEELTAENRVGLAVEILRDDKSALSRQVALRNLDIGARDRAAVVALAVVEFSMIGCRIWIAPLEEDVAPGDDRGAWPAVYLQVRDALVEGNRIETAIGERPVIGPRAPSSGLSPSRTALGGLQIAGRSGRVDVIGNRITGGLGNGITLGSVVWAPREPEFEPRPVDGVPVVGGTKAVGGLVVRPPYVVGDCCPENTPNPPGPTDEDGDPLVPSSEGDLADIRIIDNLIVGMGGSGIGVARFFELGADFDLIHVDRLTISGNRIHDCVRLEIASMSPTLALMSGWGGIALASATDLEVRDNRIEGCGATTSDPSCGLFALLVDSLALERNHIAGNGRSLAPGDRIVAGHRGGVIVLLAQVRIAPGTTGGDGEAARDDGRPAARVTGNVVASPDGPALQMNAVGPVAIEGNHLTAIGWDLATAQVLAKTNGDDPDDAGSRYAAGVAVRVMNLGRAREVVSAESSVFGRDLRSVDVLSSGLVLFDDNQVMLDLREAERSFATASVYLVTMDDLGVGDNQLTVEMHGELVDLVDYNLAALGMTVRIEGNRCKERLGSAFVSAASYGLLNTTAGNQGTHCFFVLGPTAGRVDEPNRSWVELISAQACEAVEALADRYNEALDGALGKAGRVGERFFSLAFRREELPSRGRSLQAVTPNPPTYNGDLNG